MFSQLTWFYLAVFTLGALFGACAPSSIVGGKSKSSATVTAEVTQSRSSLKVVSVQQTYEIAIEHSPLKLTVTQDGKEKLKNAEKAPLVLALRGEQWLAPDNISEARWQGSRLTLHSNNLDVTVAPEGDRFTIEVATPDEAEVEQIEANFDLASAGHWYGHGETDQATQAWPLDKASFSDEQFSPASYLMIEPFWFTSKGVGITCETKNVMAVSFNKKWPGALSLSEKKTKRARFVVVVNKTPREAFQAFIEKSGKPEKIDAPIEHFTLPVWNSWAQFYTLVTQERLLDYAATLVKERLRGHAIQLDDRWESNYGDLQFRKETFPDPKAMVAKLREMGLKLGIWVTLWINKDSSNYKEADEKGYLLKDPKDKSRSCSVEWWNGPKGAGIVDLANPEARAWYQAKLDGLVREYGISGFKFDTRFFDDHCLAREGLSRADYLKLGADLADRYDLQGVGVRLHWGMQRYGFVTRQVDKPTTASSLEAAIVQNLAISTIGYPFVTTDMIGRSMGYLPPKPEILARWAQAAALMPIMYSSTSPLGGQLNPWLSEFEVDGKKLSGEKAPSNYDEKTVERYRQAIALHEKLAPYIWQNAQLAVKTGEPIVKPLFFLFPDEEPTYTLRDEWMLGDAILAAPITNEGQSRDVYLPSGQWWDALRRQEIVGPILIKDYRVSLDEIPVFVRKGSGQYDDAMKALGTGEP